MWQSSWGKTQERWERAYSIPEDLIVAFMWTDRFPLNIQLIQDYIYTDGIILRIPAGHFVMNFDDFSRELYNRGVRISKIAFDRGLGSVGQKIHDMIQGIISKLGYTQMIWESGASPLYRMMFPFWGQELIGELNPAGSMAMFPKDIVDRLSGTTEYVDIYISKAPSEYPPYLIDILNHLSSSEDFAIVKFNPDSIINAQKEYGERLVFGGFSVLSTVIGNRALGDYLSAKIGFRFLKDSGYNPPSRAGSYYTYGVQPPSFYSGMYFKHPATGVEPFSAIYLGGFTITDSGLIPSLGFVKSLTPVYANIKTSTLYDIAKGYYADRNISAIISRGEYFFENPYTPNDILLFGWGVDLCDLYTVSSYTARTLFTIDVRS